MDITVLQRAGAFPEMWGVARGMSPGPLSQSGWTISLDRELRLIGDLSRERAALVAQVEALDRKIARRQARVTQVLGEWTRDARSSIGTAGGREGHGAPSVTAQVLAALPGTKSEVVERTGVKPTVVASLLARLQRDGGPVVKRGDAPSVNSPNRRVAVYDIDPQRAAGHSAAEWALEQRDRHAQDGEGLRA